MSEKTNIIFLHHSTGKTIWRGKSSKYLMKIGFKGEVERWFRKYNRLNKTSYLIEENEFPKAKPYGWKNYPYDYYNIWVKHAGPEPFMGEPTLELLSAKYDVIIWKHCFPVGKILEDSISDVDSEVKTLANYKLQYQALKNKMHEFPKTKFIVLTAAALVESKTNPDQAQRTREFVDWVRDSWDEANDNIYIWDLYELETGNGLYLKPEYSNGISNSHPNVTFSSFASKLFCEKIVEVIKDNGNPSTSRIK